MDKTTILKAFNSQFEEFLEDIELLFPENKDIRTTKTGLMMMRKANPKKMVSVWYRYVCIKYEDEIEKENLEYFLTKDYSTDLKMEDGAAGKVMDAIDKLREPLRELNAENTKKCVQYLKNMNQLSKIYNN
jgi:hypothetical protein